MEISRIIGPPGCGKTTYLGRQVRRAWEVGYEVMVCSLTRAAAEEVAGRDLPIARERIGTLHSHAYRSLAGGSAGIADLPKYIDEWNQEHPKLALSGGNNDLDEDNASPFDGNRPGDKLYNAMNLNRARRMPEELWFTQVASFTKLWSEWKQASDLIDFTDMLELALESQDTAPGNPNVIFADESQDFSALEWALLMKWGEAAGRLVIVGDPYQNLYEWRGSDAGLFFEGDEETLRVLQQSYRVPVAVHHAAASFIEAMPGYRPIEYYPTENYGMCELLGASYKDFKPSLKIIDRALGGDKSVMILASCSFMLQGILAQLRKEGIPFHNPYRRRNGSWNPLHRQTGKLSASDRLLAFLRMGEEGFWTKDDLRMWLSGMKCSEILPSRSSFRKFDEGPLSQISEVDGEIPYEMASILVGEAAIEASMSHDFQWYQDHLSSTRHSGSEYPVAIAKNSGVVSLGREPGLTIGTIHSVKGGESDVVILAPDLSQRGIETWHSGDAGRASIYRLFYVGMTRAKEELHVMQPSSPNAVRLM